MTQPPILRLGTRGSLLARTQSGIVADAVRRAHPGIHVELVIVKTSGDRVAEKPLHDVGGKGLFTKELEQALLDRQIDFAVHSYKDMPTTMPLVDTADLTVAAVPARQDARDVLVAERPMSIDQLPAGAKIGTGSLRRRCQLLARRPDLLIEPIRGNIDTRLRKQREGEYDATVLAMAGIQRAALFDPLRMQPIHPDHMLPAPAQGALALQCRKSDGLTRSLLALLNDPITAECVAAERHLVLLLQGDCLSPIAALATVSGERLTFRAAVGRRGGQPPILTATGDAPLGQPTLAAAIAFKSLSAQGVEKLLHEDGV